MKKLLTAVIVTVSVCAIWQFGIQALSKQRLEQNLTPIETFVATPKTIAEAFVEDGAVIAGQLGVTLVRAGAGLAIGAVLAASLAVLFVIMPVLRTFVFPVSFALNSFPIIGFVPLIVLLFGQGSWLSIIFVSMLISYFPILVTLDHAFRNVDQETVDVLRVLNANKKQVLTKLYIPLALPSFFSSLRLAIPASIIGATVVEWLGTRNGIGQLIVISLYQLRPGLLYASLLSVAFVGIAATWLLIAIEKRLFPWKTPRGI